jgi:ribonuclease D
LVLGSLLIRYQLADWRIRPLPEEMIKYSTEFGALLIENL